MTDPAITTQSTCHGQPTWWPQRKLIFGTGGMLLVLIGVALVNQFLLDQANRIDMPASVWLGPLGTALIAYFTAPAEHEGVTTA